MGLSGLLVVHSDRLQTSQHSTNDALRGYGVLVDPCSSNPRPDSGAQRDCFTLYVRRDLISLIRGLIEYCSPLRQSSVESARRYPMYLSREIDLRRRISQGSPATTYACLSHATPLSLTFPTKGPLPPVWRWHCPTTVSCTRPTTARSKEPTSREGVKVDKGVKFTRTMLNIRPISGSLTGRDCIPCISCR